MKDIISIAMGELTTAFDNEVVKAVQKVGIDVNKEELLKAIELYRSLVRCGECKKSHIDGKTTHYLWCTEWGRSTDTFGYCERGEREGE